MDHPVDDLFRIEVREEDGIVIHLAGELDVFSAPELRSALSDVAARRTRSVVLDLSKLTFIDSTGLGVLVGAHERLRLDDVELRLRNPTRPVARVLDLTGAARILAVEDSVVT